MKAMLLNAFGESFQSAEIDTPAPGPGQVPIKVKPAASTPSIPRSVPDWLPAGPELRRFAWRYRHDRCTVKALPILAGDRGMASLVASKGMTAPPLMRANAAALAPIPERLVFAKPLRYLWSVVPLGCRFWALTVSAGLIQGGTGGVATAASWREQPEHMPPAPNDERGTGSRLGCTNI